MFLPAIIGTKGVDNTFIDRVPNHNSNIVFWYERLDKQSDFKYIGENVFGVVTNQGGREELERQAVQLLHDNGKSAFRYFNPYWLPFGRNYQDINIKNNPEYIFCTKGGEPRWGRWKDKNGNNIDDGPVIDEYWYLVDLNETQARNAFNGFLNKVKEWGYDGVFFDRGGVALHGSRYWYLRSSCTENPVEEGRTLSDAYVGLMNQAKQIGLKIMVNYGPPFGDENNSALRPDPMDMDCLTGNFLDCSTKNDIWAIVDHILVELRTNTIDDNLWSRDMQWARDAEKRANGERTQFFLKNTNPDSEQRKNEIFYHAARLKLWNVPFSINTGVKMLTSKDNKDLSDYFTLDSNSLSYKNINLHYGLYPEITNIVFGDPLEKDPVQFDMDKGQNDLFIRRYQWGMALVNNSNKKISTGPISTGLQKCKHVYDVYEGNPLNNNCISNVYLTLPPWSGRLLSYSNITYP